MSRLFYITILLLFALSFSSRAQVDSSYVGSYEQKLSVKAYLSRSFIFLNETKDGKGGIDLEYMPNNPASLGFGFSWKNSALSFSYGYGFNFLRDKEYGKTKSLDFQFHNYSRKYVFDIFIQQYKGFYVENKEIILFPDLKIHQYGLHGQYIFNGKKFSYKAAFDLSEIQLKSAGSYTLGGGVYLSEIETDEPLFVENKRKIKNFQFGISGGYAYTWVIDRSWFVSGTLTIGVNFGNEAIHRIGKEDLRVYPTLFPRISGGFNKEHWSLGLTYLNNFIFPSFSENALIGLFSGNFQITYIRRFHTIPFLPLKK